MEYEVEAAQSLLYVFHGVSVNTINILIILLIVQLIDRGLLS